MSEEATVAVRLALPWDLHKALKYEALEKNTSIKAILLKIVTEHIEKGEVSGTNPNG
jgi:hypothetical protein